MRLRSSVSVVAFVLASAAVAAPQYHLTDLGIGSGGPGPQAMAINATGSIAGIRYDVGGLAQAYVYTPGVGATNLGTLGGSQSSAYAINAGGQVVGSSFTAGGRQHAFRYDPATGIHDLGSLSEDPFVTSLTLGLGIADDGTVVGTSTRSDGAYRPFLYREGTGMVELGILPGTDYLDGYGVAINSHGQIAGTSMGADASEAFVYTEGVGFVGLGHLGGAFSTAHGMNDAGYVVGVATTADNSNHPFLYTPAAGMIDIASTSLTNGEAWDVNEKGQVVGTGSGSSSLVGFLYTPGEGSVDLTTLLDTSGTGWTITSARGINDSGLIVGTAHNVLLGDRAVLLTPTAVPEPASLAGLGFGAMLLLTKRRRVRRS
jgi:probable HAF family extracellular repeat protein